MLICGLDEVGRGPIAGPVVASAVLLEGDGGISGLADSKSLSPRRRQELSIEIRKKSPAYGLGWVWQDEIDRMNIHFASLLAMVRAVDELYECSGHLHVEGGWEILVDGKFLPDFSLSTYSDGIAGLINRQEAVVKGDGKIPAISAASILAKVERDAWMVEYAQQEPEYGFAKHKGYPTALHREAIERHGPSAIQRMSFRWKKS